MHGKVTVTIDASKVKDRLGLLPGGKVHKYFMDRTQLRLINYAPYRDKGSVVDAIEQGKDYDNARWVIEGPHIKYLYYGKVMAGNPRVPTSKDLVYTKSPHPQAGPFWDRQVMQNDIKQIAREVTDFMRRG